jgi:hypothetical protein
MVYFPSRLLRFHGSEGEHFDFVVEQRKDMFVKFGEFAIIRSRIKHTLKPTICTISLNLLRYTLRQIINLNLYTHIYINIHTQHRLMIYKRIFIPGKERNLMLHTGYLAHSDRAANLIT